MTALWEETAFRGFLLPQLYLKLSGHRWVRLWGALLLSQIVFAAAHIPAHVMIRHLTGLPLLRMLLLQGFAGILLGLLYLRTRNLWIAIGICLVAAALAWLLPERGARRAAARLGEEDAELASAGLVGIERP